MVDPVPAVPARRVLSAPLDYRLDRGDVVNAVLPAIRPSEIPPRPTERRSPAALTALIFAPEPQLGKIASTTLPASTSR